MPDTLAYLINRGNNEGFVVVSIDRRLEPVLAFSDEGSFTYEEDDNDPVYSLFVKLLPMYNSTAENSPTRNMEEDDSPEYSVEPRITRGFWGQDAPFSTYCHTLTGETAAVGCVAVAAGQIMMHCRDTIVMNGRTYNSRRILQAMNDSITLSIGPILHSGGTQPNSIPGSGPVFLEGTYDWAVNEIALFVAALGPEVEMDYGVNTSTAQSDKAILPFLNHHYTLPSYGNNVNNPFQNFSEQSMTNYLVNNCLLYVDGKIFATQEVGYPANVWDQGRHAFVMDGVRYKINETDNSYYDIFLHCDWGWYGHSTGYYSGTLWHTVVNRWNAWFYTAHMKYFAVRTEQ